MSSTVRDRTARSRESVSILPSMGPSWIQVVVLPLCSRMRSDTKAAPSRLSSWSPRWTRARKSCARYMASARTGSLARAAVRQRPRLGRHAPWRTPRHRRCLRTRSPGPISMWTTTSWPAPFCARHGDWSELRSNQGTAAENARELEAAWQERDQLMAERDEYARRLQQLSAMINGLAPSAHELPGQHRLAEPPTARGAGAGAGGGPQGAGQLARRRQLLRAQRFAAARDGAIPPRARPEPAAVCRLVPQDPVYRPGRRSRAAAAASR